MASETTTIVSALDDKKTAQQAIEALRKEGFGDKEVQLIEGNADKARQALGKDGFGEDELGALIDALEDGKTLVVARVTEDKADQADEILQRFESEEDEGSEGGESVQIVEEELEIGKKKGGARGVRVSSRVKEKPVEATVKLREERVEAERRDVDRELSPEEADAAFKEKSVEVTGISEEAEIEKRARVVGEVEVTKQTGVREETVRDTVRKTDVEVEKVGGESGRK